MYAASIVFPAFTGPAFLCLVRRPASAQAPMTYASFHQSAIHCRTIHYQFLKLWCADRPMGELICEIISEAKGCVLLRQACTVCAHL